jgi:hypothetical protein
VRCDCDVQQAKLSTSSKLALSRSRSRSQSQSQSRSSASARRSCVEVALDLSPLTADRPSQWAFRTSAHAARRSEHVVRRAMNQAVEHRLVSVYCFMKCYKTYCAATLCDDTLVRMFGTLSDAVAVLDPPCSLDAIRELVAIQGRLNAIIATVTDDANTATDSMTVYR